MNVTEFEASGSWDIGNVTSAKDLFMDQMANSDMGLFEMLCGCTELDGSEPRACVQAWVEVQKYKAFFVINCLFAFEGVCAVLAWKYVDVIDDEDVLKMRKKRNRPIQLPGMLGDGVGAMTGLVGGVTGAADKGLSNVPLVGEGAGKLIGGLAGGLAPGWALAADRFGAGMAMGEDLQEKARHEAVLLTRTWYFEGTVLFASLVVFLVLAIESYTTRPSPDMLVVLRMGELFVTLFLTVDVFIQVAICMTPAERRRIPKSPWVIMDFVVLMASWGYLMTHWRVFSIGRVLRVLRPLRTLRMLSQINQVLETIVDAMPLFLQAMVLITFLQVMYCLICMSLWSGGLNYRCDPNRGASIRPPPPRICDEETGDGCDEIYNGSDSASWSQEEDPWIPDPVDPSKPRVRNWEGNRVLKCPAAIICKDQEDPDDFFAATYCKSFDQPMFIRSEEYGFTGPPINFCDFNRK